MFPPIYALAAATPAVTSIFGVLVPGVSKTRIFPFGESLPRADPMYATPYAVWQSIGINPENYVDRSPDIDFMPTQIDVYADTATAARNGAQALRDLYQQHGYVTVQREWPREPDTNLYRYQIDVDFWQNR